MYLDFETFWSQEHSLSKMLPIEYVMHPETEIQFCSIKVNDEPVTCSFGESNIKRALDKIDWSKSLAVAHNMSGFDSMLLAWRLKIRPRMWGCTLAMARPRHALTTGLGLGKLLTHFNLGVKNNIWLQRTKGKKLHEMTREEIRGMTEYCSEDTGEGAKLFHKLRPDINNREMWIIDANIRMLIDPQFVIDRPLLEAALVREQAKKRKTLLRLADALQVNPVLADDDRFEHVRALLSSAPKFSSFLASRDIETPMKPSPKDENKMIPALAKSDPAFMELTESDDELVSMAALARLDIKSTLLETRIGHFLNAGRWTNEHLPIPAKYYGAHTGRDSGDWYNALNMPRIGWGNDNKIIPKLTNALRLSPRAPKGKVCIVADLSGIELRINHTLWKVKYSTEMWKKNPVADLYKSTAAFYYKVDEAEVTKQQRQFGKIQQLGCGFQVGGKKFKVVARTMGGLILTEEEAEAGVYSWRNMTPEISAKETGGWARCQTALTHIANGQEYQVDPWGLTYTSHLGIHLACDRDRLIYYPELRAVLNEDSGYVEWKYGKGRNTKYIYGGKTDENIVQALGRTILMDNELEFFRLTGLRPALRVYDELCYVVDENKADELLALLLKIMRTPPKWWPELVVWSEGDAAPAYGLAK